MLCKHYKKGYAWVRWCNRKFLSVQIPTIYLYHLNDQASGSGGHDIIPSVKSIKGDLLNEMGMMATSGAIRKKKTKHKQRLTILFTIIAFLLNLYIDWYNFPLLL